MAQVKRSDTIVVNELLAFVQNKLDVMDELSLEQICATSYTEKDILAAKKVLSDTATTTVRLGTRQRDGHGKKDLQDIFRALKETDPDDVPTYVAQDLNKLPPVTFDHVDVTRLLKDITLLRADVTEIRSKLDISERTVAELKVELAVLHNKSAAPAISPSSSRNINTRRGGGVRNSTLSNIDNKATDTDSRQGNDRATRPTRVVDTSFHVTSPGSPTIPLSSSRPQKETYAQKSRNSCPSRPMHSDGSRQANQVAKVVPLAPQPPKTDKDGFTLVERKKRPCRQNRNKRGTAPAAGITLRAAAPTIPLYISRFEKSTAGEDIIKYIREKNKSRTGEHIGLELTRLESSRTKNFKSYMLQIPAKHKETFLSPDFWPEGIVFRRYRGAKPPTKPV